MDLRKSLIESVSEHDVRNGDWKNVFDADSLQGEDIAILFDEASFKKKVRNHRTYIGPGADGSSDDKIAVDMKFNAKETTVTFKDEWRSWQKTVIALHQTPSGDNEWRMVQCAVPVQEVYYFEGDDRPPKCAVFIHPPKKEETAYYATRMTPFDDSFVDLFKPDLACDKVTTMTKTQKGIVKKGEEAVREQYIAMWMTIRGATTRKILLAVTTATVAFRHAAGHMTKVMDPGPNGELIDSKWIEHAKKYINEENLDIFQVVCGVVRGANALPAQGFSGQVGRRRPRRARLAQAS